MRKPRKKWSSRSLWIFRASAIKIIIMFIVRFSMRDKQMNNGLFFFLLGKRSVFFRSFEWKVGFKQTTQKSETYWFSKKMKKKQNGFRTREEIEDLINLFKMYTRAIHQNVNIQLQQLLSYFNRESTLYIMWQNQKMVSTTS